MFTALHMYLNFVSIFNAALETYKRKTKNDLARIRSFPTFNLAIYPRLFSPSFESKPPHSANPQTVTTGSQNRLSRL
jgi:hypothetical protein